MSQMRGTKPLARDDALKEKSGGDGGPGGCGTSAIWRVSWALCGATQERLLRQDCAHNDKDPQDLRFPDLIDT